MKVKTQAQAATERQKDGALLQLKMEKKKQSPRERKHGYEASCMTVRLDCTHIESIKVDSVAPPPTLYCNLERTVEAVRLVSHSL